MANYKIKTTMTDPHITSMVDEFKIINTNDTLERYSHVQMYSGSIGSLPDCIDGEFLVSNPPSSIPARKFYLEIIRIAESRNIEKKNGTGNGYITISDIAKVIDKVNSSPMRISHGRIFIQLSGSKITDILPGKIECCYKFPMDNAYMVIYKSRPNLIEIMSGDMKFSREVEDKDVNN
jgi:hypothetical protein